MSFVNLPQELKDMIYEFAIPCPPGGVTIQVEHGWRLSSEDRFRVKHPPLQCGQNHWRIASGLLCTSREINARMSRLLYGNNLFILDMACSEALLFLQSLPTVGKAQIKHLTLTKKFMWVDENEKTTPTYILWRGFIHNPRLESVTLAIPDGPECLHDHGRQLHALIMLEFAEGRFNELRFSFPDSPQELWSIEVFLPTTMNIQFCLERVARVNGAERAWKRALHGAKTASGDRQRQAAGLLNSYFDQLWRACGYTIDRNGERRPGENGVVAVILRLPLEESRPELPALLSKTFWA